MSRLEPAASLGEPDATHASHAPPARAEGRLRIYGTGVADAIGLGIYLSLSALYLKEGVGLSNAEVGWVLGTSGVASLFGAMPIARAAQRLGLRRGLCLLMLARAAVFLLLSFVDSLPFALVAIALTGATSRATSPLIEATLIGDEERSLAMQSLARLRVIRTSGIAAGGLPVGIAVWIGTPLAYRAVMAGSAVLYLIAALLCVGAAGKVVGAAQRPAPARSVLANRPFVILTAAYGCLTLATIVLGVGLPLWVVEHSSAPSWIVGAFKLVNTLCVIAWQGRANRGTQVFDRALARLRTGGLLAAVSSAAVMALGTAGALGDVAVVLVIVLLFSFGEVYIVAGGQGAALAHIPEGQRPTYMAAFNLGFGCATVVGPLLVTATVSGASWGWLAWGGFFAVLAAAVGMLPAPVPARES